MPAVSVIMVFHRVTPFLLPAVRSVLAQTFSDWELVLVDNGTGEGLAPLGETGRDPRIQLVSLPANWGIARGHNAALTVARGEFIALLDYDDLMLPRRLELQVAALRADPSLGLVSSRAEAIDDQGRVTGPEFSLMNGDDQRRYSEFAAPVVTPAFTGRREVFARFPYRTEFTFGADFDFLARALEQYPSAGVPEVLLHYRRHSAQTTIRESARIEPERAIVRLLAARRRAGRPEGGDWPALLAETKQVPDVAGYLLTHAERCLAEGFPLQAAYHARRSVAARRTPRAFLRAYRLYRRARAIAGEAAAPVARMFWRGLVKALEIDRS